MIPLSRLIHGEGAGSPVMGTGPASSPEPEHSHDCYRLIRPGITYSLTIGQAILGENGRLLVRCGGSVVEALPHEVRHLVANDSSEPIGKGWPKQGYVPFGAVRRESEGPRGKRGKLTR